MGRYQEPWGPGRGGELTWGGDADGTALALQLPEGGGSTLALAWGPDPDCI